MPFIKHATGEVLPEEEETTKTASQQWTETDEAELEQENAEADQ